MRFSLLKIIRESLKTNILICESLFIAPHTGRYQTAPLSALLTSISFQSSIKRRKLQGMFCGGLARGLLAWFSFEIVASRGFYHDILTEIEKVQTSYVN